MSDHTRCGAARRESTYGRVKTGKNMCRVRTGWNRREQREGPREGEDNAGLSGYVNNLVVDTQTWNCEELFSLSELDLRIQSHGTLDRMMTAIPVPIRDSC